jgi:hypothetical protein
MILIRDLVEKVLKAGYLSLEAEEQLRNLLQTKYDSEDFNAFMNLQQAAMSGFVRQQSREIKVRSHSSS